MWEIALLIIAVAFAVAVIFTVPVLLQLWASAKELEFTLRETRETLRRLREISEKAEAVIDTGQQVIGGAHKALMSLDALVGKSGTRFLARALSTALEFLPVAMSARKLFTRGGRGKDHV